VKFILTTLLVSSLFTCVAQNEQTFGDSLFTQFQSDNNQWNDWYISLETYHRLIERQRMSKDVQDDFMLSINESYESQMQNFVSTMQEMQSVYNVEQDDKSYYELTTIKTEALKDVKLVYFFRLFITYHWKKGEDKYIIEFQACYLNKEWHMMEPFQEFYE
jgi:hypothetical protein